MVRSPGATDSFRLAMVAAVEDLRVGQHAGNLVEHADEVFDRLLGPLGGDLRLLLLQVVGGGRLYW